MHLVAVDPGDVHVGVASWSIGEPDLPDRFFGGTSHADPETFMLRLKAFDPDVVVVESFHLHPWRAEAQTWSTMPTAQLIGRIKQVASDCGAEVYEQTSDLQRLSKQTPYYKRHVADHGEPHNPHERSALQHGIYFLHMNPKGPNLD